MSNLIKIEFVAHDIGRKLLIMDIGCRNPS